MASSLNDIISDLEDIQTRLFELSDSGFYDDEFWSAEEIVEDAELEIDADEIDGFAWNHPDWWTQGLLNETGREHVVLLSPTDIRFTDSGVEAVVAQFAE